jgi:flagellin
MTTGYKINHASDNAAGLSIANQWETQLGSLDIAADNAATGADMLTTAEETYSLLTEHLQRVRDLTEQAANGTYGSQSLKAIQSEVAARLEEVSRISANAEFNGIKLMSYTQDGDGSGITSEGVNLQVGLYANDSSVINLDVSLFNNASISGLFNSMLSDTATKGKTLTQILNAANNGEDVDNLNSANGIQAFAAACSGLVYDSTDGSFTLQSTEGCGANQMLGFLDSAINEISDRVTKIGAAQNRVSSALSALDVQSENLTSSLSTLRDTDVAEESSNYLQAQILQQASATLLSTANQLPSIALNLI